MKLPWTYLEDKIDDYLHDKYYEKTKCGGYTAEQIVEGKRKALEGSPFLVKLSDILSTIDVYFTRYVIDVIKYPELYYKNAIRDKTHVIPTGLKKGEWHDSTSRLFHGVFELVKFFVEHEGKGSLDYYKENEEFRKSCPEHQRETYDTVLAAYDWYMNDYPRLNKEIDALYDEVDKINKEYNIGNDSLFEQLVDKGTESDEKRKKVYDKIQLIEDEIRDAKIKHMKDVCGVVDGLWD